MAIDINIPIEDSVTDGSLNPVTSNAVFDALALKANSADLSTVATSGDYNDLSNLPSIPAAQVNADWNATSGVAEILNKPTIPSVTGFVPYTGATNDVDLGVHDLTATQGTFATSGNPDTLTVNHSSGSGKALTITKGGNGEGVYVNKTSGSGNAVTVIGDLEATNLKRTGGTSAQFLKANGSIDSTSYQPTLVSGTSIKTINGNSLLGSGDLVISGGGGAITIGTTAITSGTDGRVLFQAGGVVQEDSALFWDNTNKRLGVGATPSTSVRLDVRAQGALSTNIALRIRNSADNDNLLYVAGNGLSILGINASSSPTVILDPAGSTRLTLRGGTNNSISLNNSSANILESENRGWDIVNGTGNTRIRTSMQYFYIYKGSVQLNVTGEKNTWTATNSILLENGTAPSTNIADNAWLFVGDQTAGNACFKTRTENGAVIQLYQETTGVGASTLIGGGGTALTDTDTFDGYTLKQIVKALRNQGLLA